MNIRVLMPDNDVIQMHIEEYLRGVVPSEVSPNWPMEALRAQAVSARTYAVRRVRYPKHIDNFADVCCCANCCQAYHADRLFWQPRTNAAVLETQGEVIVYNDCLIDAVYHSACGGHTLNSEEVWRNAEPYLRGVECKCGREKFGHGVGLCQWGAFEMAKAGATYTEILKHYYTGVQIVGNYGNRDDFV